MSIRSNTDARSLNQRVKIQRQVQTQDPATGRSTASWSLVIECWARVDAQKVGASSGEPVVSAEKSAIETLTVWVRSDIVTRFAVDTSMRILWNTLGRDRAYDIKSVLNQQLVGRLMPMIVSGGLGDGE